MACQPFSSMCVYWSSEISFDTKPAKFYTETGLDWPCHCPRASAKAPAVCLFLLIRSRFFGPVSQRRAYLILSLKVPRNASKIWATSIFVLSAWNGAPLALAPPLTPIPASCDLHRAALIATAVVVSLLNYLPCSFKATGPHRLLINTSDLSEGEKRRLKQIVPGKCSSAGISRSSGFKKNSLVGSCASLLLQCSIALPTKKIIDE